MTFLTRKLLPSLWLGLMLPGVFSQTCPQVLMSTDDGDEYPAFIRQGESYEYDGIVITQQWGGNLQVYAGVIGQLDCLIWENEYCDVDQGSDAWTYITRLRDSTSNRAGELLTARRPPSGGPVDAIVWQKYIM